jgi:hypothetical protein
MTTRPHHSQLDNTLIERLIEPHRDSFAQTIGAIINPHLK